MNGEQLAQEWRRRARHYDLEARLLRGAGDPAGADDAQAASDDYYQAAVELELGLSPAGFCTLELGAVA